LSAKKRSKIIWDALATEYYSEIHKTTRNFDKIIRHNVLKLVKKLHANGLYFDLGGGRGLVEELYKKDNVSIVIGDFSVPMMRTRNESFSSTSQIQMDAFKMPFRANIFDGVFSFLGDPYALQEVFGGVLRILKPNGFFLLTLPSKIWAENLRPFLGVELNETRFITRDGKLVNIPSFVFGTVDLRVTLLDVGFKKVKAGEWQSLNLISKEEFSKDILTSARNLGISPENLPLITYALAWKGGI